MSHYRINVARRARTVGAHYVHLFATGETLLDSKTAGEVFRKLVHAFPAPDYAVSVALVEQRSSDVTAEFSGKR